MEVGGLESGRQHGGGPWALTLQKKNPISLCFFASGSVDFGKRNADDRGLATLSKFENTPFAVILSEAEAEKWAERSRRIPWNRQ
jgi:hypothetical protein